MGAGFGGGLYMGIGAGAEFDVVPLVCAPKLMGDAADMASFEGDAANDEAPLGLHINVRHKY